MSHNACRSNDVSQRVFNNFRDIRPKIKVNSWFMLRQNFEIKFNRPAKLSMPLGVR